MACYDPNSLTASGTGELSVHLKNPGGLISTVDGIQVDFSNTGTEAGLHLVGNQLSAFTTPTLNAYKGVQATGGSINPFTSANGLVTVVNSGTISFTNTTPYQALFCVTASWSTNIEVTPNSEWNATCRLWVSGTAQGIVTFKLRNRGGGTQIIGETFNYSRVIYRTVAAGGTISFASELFNLP